LLTVALLPSGGFDVNNSDFHFSPWASNKQRSVVTKEALVVMSYRTTLRRNHGNPETMEPRVTHSPSKPGCDIANPDVTTMADRL
jgi:hypothetical protein